MMINIFNLSLHRTATQSAHDLFRRSQVSSAHWVAQVDGVDYQEKVLGREDDLDHVVDVLEPVIRSFVALNDAPFSALYRPLLVKYPNAKYFAFHRPPTAWVKSVRRHFGSRGFEPFERVIYWIYFIQRPKSLSDISDSELVAFHEWQHDQLTTQFKSDSRFLMLSLDGNKLGPKLCEFCGLAPLPLRVVDYALGHDITVDPSMIDAKECE